MQHLPIRYFAWMAIPLVTFSTAASLLLPQSVSADAQITLSPTSHRLSIVPGETYEGSLTLINSGDDPMEVRVYAAPYQVANKDYSPIFSKQTPRTQISRWTHFDKEVYRLNADEQIRVPFTITTPPSIPDGGQYAAIFAETSEEQTGSITSQKRVGMIVYAESKGRTSKKGSAKITSPGAVHLGTARTFHSHLINSGNTDLAGVFKVTVTDVFGKKLFAHTQEKVVLPDTTRSVPIKWDSTPSFALAKVHQTTTFADKTTTNQRWILFLTPAAVLVVSGGLAMLLAGGIYALRRSKRRPQLRRRG